MELRILRYFFMVAKEQSFTRAAEQLHITQPTLSRQLAALEEELGIELFIRKGKNIMLTDEGMLLKRRALEILDLEERTLEELKRTEEVIEGTVTVGCGEFAAVETLAKICKKYKEKYPLVQIAIHTATADTIYEMMNKGLVDVALFMEPVDTEGLDYIRIMDSDHWVVGMRPDDLLAEKEFIEKQDLIGSLLFCRKEWEFRVNLPTGLERIFPGPIFLLRVILAQMPELWRQMGLDIRYLSKGRQNTGEKTFWFREDFSPKLLRVP